MALLLTLDASVWVAACRRHEPDHLASRSLLAALREREVPLVEPSILPVEVGAALSRTGDDAQLAQQYAEAILTLPHLTLVDVDGGLARRATALAVSHRLRGADAIYIAAAIHYGARLVTLDREQLRRAPTEVLASRPAAAADLLPKPSRR